MSIFTEMLEQVRPAPQSAAFLNEEALSALSGGPTSAGITVGTETAMKISTVWACAGLIADCIGMLPAVVFERMPDGSRQRATSHPLYDVLHDLPNSKQTAFEFKSQMTLYALMRGSARARIVPGARGFADQLVPIHPDQITAERTMDGAVRYVVTEANGSRKVYNDEDIFDVRGLSLDGLNGLSVVSHARESLGLALAGERAGAKTFSNGSRPSGVLQVKGKLSPDAQKRMRASWQAANAGTGNDGGTAVLEEGTEWRQISMTNKDSQWLESREFQAEDICRWFRVPPHMVGLTSKSTSWGSGIEQMSIGFVTYTLMPWITRWQQAISRDLILATQKYFVEFIVEGLLRGDALSRYNVYRIGREIGVFNPNEIRRLENMNPRTDPGGEAYVTPLNMAPSVAEAAEHYDALLHEAAGRAVRKEVSALIKIAQKHPEHSDGWKTAVNDFYAGHVLFVSQTLRVSPELAQLYVNEQLGELGGQGLAAIADWETRRVADLARLAQGER